VSTVRQLLAGSGPGGAAGGQSANAADELAVVPGTSHFLLQEKPTLCNRVMIDFLTQEPVAMVAPIRTRGAGRGVRTRD